jgi:hypothetical protein
MAQKDGRRLLAEQCFMMDRLFFPSNHSTEMKNAYKVLVGNPEGKRSLGGRTGRILWTGFEWLRILSSGGV